MTRRELILATVEDLVSDFICYDRKEDEELGMGDIEEAIGAGEITVDEIVERFRAELAEVIAEMDSIVWGLDIATSAAEE